MGFSSSSPLPYVEEKTEVICSPENVDNYAVGMISTVRLYIDNCINSVIPSIFVIPNHPVTNAYRELRARGIRLRFITEITKDNIAYCKKLMKIYDLRPLDEVKGNFGIVDGLYYTVDGLYYTGSAKTYDHLRHHHF
jgi:two-component system, OmpR family, sensor histidine kinase VicK